MEEQGLSLHLTDRHPAETDREMARDRLVRVAHMEIRHAQTSHMETETGEKDQKDLMERDQRDLTEISHMGTDHRVTNDQTETTEHLLSFRRRMRMKKIEEEEVSRPVRRRINRLYQFLIRTRCRCAWRRNRSQ